MRRRLTFILLLAAACATTRDQPVVQPFADAKYWVLRDSLRYGDLIIPAGFVTDFASVPRLFWTLFPRTGRYLVAAIVHDYLYWTQTATREEADQVFLAAMKRAGVNEVQASAMYYTVRLTGDLAWTANARDKAAGRPRIIPRAKLRSIPPDATWEEFQRTLSR